MQSGNLEPSKAKNSEGRETKQLEKKKSTYFISNHAFIQLYSTTTPETINFFIGLFYNGAQIWHLLLKFYSLDLFPAWLVCLFIVL